MFRERVRTIDEAFLYILDCNLATVEHISILKSKSDFKRQIQIAQCMIDWIKEFNIKVPKNERAFEIINNYKSSVKDWSGRWIEKVENENNKR